MKSFRSLKLICLLLTFLFTSTTKVYSQAHLGYTENQIKALHPENEWKAGYTNSGVRYISTFFGVECFFYYFDKDNGLSINCVDIVPNTGVLNGVVEKYNHKYVITSNTTWTAYLENGGIMYITLKYSEESNLSYFSFSPAR